jgi:epoxyqueuosine reductase
MTLTDDIKHKALQLGFDLVGVTDASALGTAQIEFLRNWLQAGYAAKMNFMHRNLEKRIDPAKLLDNAQSVIIVGLNYKPPKQSHLDHTKAHIGKIAAYAQYEDYHPFIKSRLHKLSDFIASIAGKNLQFKICVDSAPLQERALAVRAGLGFIGTNRMLIHPQLGPQIFLGEILTTLKLQPDQLLCCHSERSEESRRLIPNNCSTCNKCIAACPTGALRPDGFLDANKCINYLTIEYKGEIHPNFAEKIGDRLFGCDECVLACPYQQNAPVCKNTQFRFYPNRATINLHDILSLSDESFESGFADSVIKRLGLEALKRNARICLSNFKC